jgi:U3 small nucleolar RNA-associated protein 25
MPPKEPSISSVLPKVKQVFQKLNCESFVESAELRFNYFVNKILKNMNESTHSHILVYIPSYFDAVRLRNHFKKEELSFALMSEYTPRNKVARYRSEFFHGRIQFLLYTERFHFYHRLKIRGIQHIVFYSLPLCSEFYSETLNFLSSQGTSSVALYTKYERFQLESIVDAKRADRMLASGNDLHLFC